MIKSAELVFEKNIITVDIKNGVVTDLTIWDEDNEILFSGTAIESEYVAKAIEFALGYNFKLNESGLTTGLEPDRQEVE